MTAASHSLLTPKVARWALLNWEWEIMGLFKPWCLGILIQNEASLRKKCHANSNRGAQYRSSG
jgi:hypothetical protein